MTPVRAKILKNLLEEAQYDAEEVDFLFNGFSKGFAIGYQGSLDCKLTAKNLPFRCGSKTQLWNKMVKEVNLGGFAGPFDRIPYDNFTQSPAGLVPKDHDANNNDPDAATRLIFHLSYHDQASVNFHTPKEVGRVKYKDLDYAVRLCMEVSKENGT